MVKKQSWERVAEAPKNLETKKEKPPDDKVINWKEFYIDREKIPEKERVQFFEFGKGSKVFFWFPGLLDVTPGTNEDEERIIDWLTKTYKLRVVYMDYPFDTFATAKMQEEILDYCSRHKLREVGFIGTSIGGTVAMDIMRHMEARGYPLIKGHPLGFVALSSPLESADVEPIMKVVGRAVTSFSKETFINNPKAVEGLLELLFFVRKVMHLGKYEGPETKSLEHHLSEKDEERIRSLKEYFPAGRLYDSIKFALEKQTPEPPEDDSWYAKTPTMVVRIEEKKDAVVNWEASSKMTGEYFLSGFTKEVAGEHAQLHRFDQYRPALERFFEIYRVAEKRKKLK